MRKSPDRVGNGKTCTDKLKTLHSLQPRTCRYLLDQTATGAHVICSDLNAPGQLARGLRTGLAECFHKQLSPSNTCCDRLRGEGIKSQLLSMKMAPGHFSFKVCLAGASLQPLRCLNNCSAMHFEARNVRRGIASPVLKTGW